MDTNSGHHLRVACSSCLVEGEARTLCMFDPTGQRRNPEETREAMASCPHYARYIDALTAGEAVYRARY